MLSINKLRKLSFLVYGLGSTGKSVVNFFKRNDIKKFEVWDDKNKDLYKKNRAENLNKAVEIVDFIILSPGISLKNIKGKNNLEKFEEKIITDIDLIFLMKNFFKSIVVTGTNGKSTTSKIISHVLQKNGYKTLLGGNIGKPVLSLKSKKNDFLIIEVSSFQLSHSKYICPDYAILLNISNDHLDWHGNKKNYKNSKFKIFKNQKKNQFSLIGNNFKTEFKKRNLKGKLIIPQLKNYKKFKEKMVLGGAVTIENFLDSVRSKMPELIEILQRFGSPQIRNQGTIGGNLCTSSPIGDLAPLLMVLNSDINVFGKNGIKKTNIKNFFKGYRKNILKKDEIILSIEIPYPNKKNKIFSWKLSKRYDQDISTISLAINIQTQKNIIKEIQMAAGGVAATPKSLDKLCKSMLEKKLDDAIDFATENLDKFIQPISDLRGSSHYRLEAMKGLFRRLQICLRQDKESLSIMEV